MCATRSQPATTLGGQPLALGADEQRHLAVGRPAQRLALARHERDALARQRRRRVARARRGTAKIAPMLARTALGPNGSAQSGPERDAGGAEGERAAQHRARRCPGRATPCRYDAQRARRAAPSAARRRRAPACPSRARDAPASSSGSTSVPSQPAAGGDVALERRPARRVGGGEQVLALGDEAPARARAPRRRASLRTSLSCSLWGLK